MKKPTRSTSRAPKYRQFEDKIRGEELALVTAIRKAEEELRCPSPDDESEDEVGADGERETWAIKTNYYRRRLRIVRESLDRLSSGKFGVCAACEQEISEKRLNAVPTAIYCLECQEALERGLASDQLSA